MEHTKEHPMTATTMTLVEFLRARLDEDEGRAEEAALDEVRWREREPGMVVTHKWAREALATDGEFGYRLIPGAPSPARVLAEVEAKRRIVDECAPRYAILYRDSDRLLAEAFDQPTVPTVAHSGPVWPSSNADTILRLLALPYADHPDHRDEWRP